MIKFLRGFLVSIMFMVFGFGALYLRYCIFPFKKNKSECYEVLKKTWKGFISFIEITKIIDVNIKDLERIKNIKNSIIVSTHPSFIDIVILMSVIPNSTCFVAEKLSKNPFLSGIVKYLFILEGQETDIWLNECSKKMNEGLNVIIFPMGRRHKKNEFLKIRKGCALLAQKTKKDIIMLNIETNRAFLQNGQSFCDAGYDTVLYTIEYLGEIKTNDFLEKYSDEVTFKKEITKEIARNLYKQQN